MHVLHRIDAGGDPRGNIVRELVVGDSRGRVNDEVCAGLHAAFGRGDPVDGGEVLFPVPPICRCKERVGGLFRGKVGVPDGANRQESAGRIEAEQEGNRVKDGARGTSGREDIDAETHFAQVLDEAFETRGVGGGAVAGHGEGGGHCASSWVFHVTNEGSASSRSAKNPMIMDMDVSQKALSCSSVSPELATMLHSAMSP